MCLLVAPGLYGQHRAGERDRSLRDETFRIAEAYLISHLQESLALTDDEFTRVMPLVRQVQAARRRSAEERGDRLRQLRQLLASNTATPPSVEAALAGAREAEVEGPARVRKAMEALDGALTPLQQAKYRVFEFEVETRIRRLLTRGAGRDNGRRPRPPR